MNTLLLFAAIMLSCMQSMSAKFFDTKEEATQYLCGEIKDTTVFGTILTEDGRTYEMNTWVDDSDRNNLRYYISYEVPFASAGDYIVRIYHHPEETTILNPVCRDKTETDTEIIVIEG